MLTLIQCGKTPPREMHVSFRCICKPAFTSAPTTAPKTTGNRPRVDIITGRACRSGLTESGGRYSCTGPLLYNIYNIQTMYPEPPLSSKKSL